MRLLKKPLYLTPEFLKNKIVLFRQRLKNQLDNFLCNCCAFYRFKMLIISQSHGGHFEKTPYIRY